MYAESGLFMMSEPIKSREAGNLTSRACVAHHRPIPEPATTLQRQQLVVLALKSLTLLVVVGYSRSARRRDARWLLALPCLAVQQ